MWWVAAALAFSVGDRSWGPDQRPIVWHVIEEGELGCPLAEGACVEELEHAFDAWAEASAGATRHSYGGPCSEADLDSPSITCIGFASGSGDTAREPGVTLQPGPEWRGGLGIRSGHLLIDRDELLGSGCVERTFAHEVGHLLGLEHTCTPGDVCREPELVDAAMHHTPRCGVEVLSPDDVAGIQEIYFQLDLQCTTSTADQVVGAVCDDCDPFTVNCLPLAEDVEVLGGEWTFGDGGTASTLEATHTYDTEGVFHVGGCFDWQRDGFAVQQTCARRYNYVVACGVPRPRFTVEHAHGLTYELENLTPIVAEPCIAELLWTFSGPAEVPSSKVWAFEQTFPEEGDYTVRLEVGGMAGTGAAELEVEIEDKNALVCGHLSAAPYGFGAVLLLVAARRRTAES